MEENDYQNTQRARNDNSFLKIRAEKRHLKYIVSHVISRWRSQETKPIGIHYSIKHGDRLGDRIHKRSPGVMPAVGHGSRIDLINRKPNAVQPNKPELPVLGVGSSGVSRTRLLGNNANLNWSWSPMCVRCSVLRSP